MMKFIWFVMIISNVMMLSLSSSSSSMPQPFTRELLLTKPPMSGNDVIILQHMLNRSVFVSHNVNVSGVFDESTMIAVQHFQAGHGLVANGVVDVDTCVQILRYLSCDNYHDDGKPASAYGSQYKYKIYVPVHKNRSIETTGSLFDSNNNLLMMFPARAHGHDCCSSSTWPDYNNSGDGLNMYSPDGNTVTGLGTVDLNSPESIPRLYGPYPINRIVLGLDGNAQWLLPHVRNGLLIHTGEWPNWTPSQSMPNSAGCIHSHPSAIDTIWKTLVNKLGVVVRKNPDGVLPYPYVPQGIISIAQIEPCEWDSHLIV